MLFCEVKHIPNNLELVKKGNISVKNDKFFMSKGHIFMEWPCNSLVLLLLSSFLMLLFYVSLDYLESGNRQTHSKD